MTCGCGGGRVGGGGKEEEKRKGRNDKEYRVL